MKKIRLNLYKIINIILIYFVIFLFFLYIFLNLYTQNKIIPAFFVLGLSFFYLLFILSKFLSSDSELKFNYLKITYNSNLYIFILKFIILIFFIFLGEYFSLIRKKTFALISFTAAIFQVFLIFGNYRIIETEQFIEKEKISKQKENISEKLKKVLVLLTVLVAIFIFYFLSENLSKQNKLISFVIFFVGGILFSFTYDKVYIYRIPSQEKYIFDYIIIVIFAIIAFYLRTIDLHNVPPGVSFDEGLSLAMAQIQINNNWPDVFIPDGTMQVGTLYYYLIGIWGSLFGLTPETARVFNAIISSIGVIFIYWLGKELYNRRVAILSSLFLTYFYYDIMYTRTVFAWALIPATSILIFLFYILALKTNKKIYAILSGIFLGVILYFYNASKMAPLIILFYFVFLLIKKETMRVMFTRIPILIMILLSAIVIFTPMIYYIINQPTNYFFRIQLTSIFPFLAKMEINSAFKYFINHAIEAILMFTTKSSSYGYFNYPNKPLIDSIGAVFFLLGFSYVIISWKKNNNMFLLIWFFISMFTVFFSIHPDDPNSQRTIMTIPAIVLIIAVAVDRILYLIEYIKNVALNIICYSILCLCLFFSIADNIYTYFVLYKNDIGVQSAFFKENQVAVDAVLENWDCEKFISPYFIYTPSVTEVILAKEKGSIRIFDVSLLKFSELFDNRKKDIFILVEGIYNKYIDILKEYFPNVQIKRYWNLRYLERKSDLHYRFTDIRQPDLFCIGVRIPESDLKNLFGLKLKIIKNDKFVYETKIDKIKYINAMKDADEIVFESLIEIPQFGKFYFVGNNNCEIYIDNKKINNKWIELFRGLHRIKVIYKKINDDKINIFWQSEEMSQPEEIPERFFINSEKIYGLLGEYYYNNKIMYKQLDPSINFRYYFNNPRIKLISGQTYFKVFWSGYIRFKEKAYYELFIHTPYFVELYIDDELIYRGNDYKTLYKKKIYSFSDKKKIDIILDFKGSSEVFLDVSNIQLKYKKNDSPIFMPISYDMLIYK